ncbi:MAG: glycosyltransferase [Paludibacteraceae bacterium]|nr:glycosyltransferase [Paludibacteraceae bacterium]
MENTFGITMIKVSVILPVYGVAEYIVKCTQSLLAQTLYEMEFLFVDDRGPDNSIELLRQTIAGHPREKQFRILTPEHNLGAGMARNFAIPEAKGEYIAFVDSDDWVEPDMFEHLYNRAKEQGCADLCMCQASKDYLDGTPSQILTNPEIGEGAFSHEMRAFFLTHYVSYFWTFIYKREFVEKHSIRYPEDRSADDSFFLACALMTASSVARVDAPFYHYLIRPGSVTTTKDSVKYKKRLAVFSKLMAYAKEQGVYEELQPEIDFLYIKKGYLSSLVNYTINAQEPKKEVFAEIYQALLAEVPDYKQNRYVKNSKAIRALLFICHNCPSLAIPLLRFYAKRNNVVS